MDSCEARQEMYTPGFILGIIRCGGSVPVTCPAWCGFRLACDQPCACLSRAQVAGQRDQELVSGGHRRRRCSGRRGRGRRYIYMQEQVQVVVGK